MAYEQVEVFASAARTVAASAEVTVPPAARAVEVTVTATAFSDTPSVTLSFQVPNAAGSGWVTILTSAALTEALGTVRLIVGEGIVAVANVAAQAVLPSRIRVLSAEADTDALTYQATARFR